MDIKKAQVENRSIRTAIDSNSYNLALDNASDANIVYLWEATRDLKINEFKDIDYPNFILHMTKVDDGAYSGHIVKREVDMGDEIPFRFESKSIPEIVSAMEIKEYIDPAVIEQMAEAVVEAPSQEPISVDAGKGVSITINIQKSIEQVKDLLKKASTENSNGQRNQIANDLCKALTMQGFSQAKSLEILNKSDSINDVLGKLNPRARAGFLNRINGQRKAFRDVRDIQKSITMPEIIESDGDIREAKKAFGQMVSILSKSRPSNKASSITFAFFKSKYGKDAMNRIKKSIKRGNRPDFQKNSGKTDRGFGKLGDTLKAPVDLIKSTEAANQPDELNPRFVSDPFKSFPNIQKK